MGRDGDTELGQTPLGVSSSTTCFLEVKSGYEEHQGSFEEEVIKGQATAWVHECVLCAPWGRRWGRAGPPP